MKSNLPNLPPSDDPYWMGGYKEKIELKESAHKHKLFSMGDGRLACSCGWELKVKNPEKAKELVDFFRG